MMIMTRLKEMMMTADQPMIDNQPTDREWKICRRVEFEEPFQRIFASRSCSSEFVCLHIEKKTQSYDLNIYCTHD